MTQQQDLRQKLHAAGEEVPTGSAPVQGLIRDGRHAKRRRQALNVVSIVAVVAAIAVGAFLLRPPVGGSGNLATQPTTSPSNLAAPAGMQLVGMNGVAVAIPETWGITPPSRCGAPIERVVFEPSREGFDICAPSRVSFLHLSDLSYWQRSFPQQPHSAGDLDGVPIARTEVTSQIPCRLSVPLCPFTGAILVPDRDLAMWVTSTEKSVVNKILDTARLIPSGYTAVPDLSGMTAKKARQVAEKDGLTLVYFCNREDASTCHFPVRPPLTSTRPVAGTVVPVGSNIELVFGTDTPTPPEESPPIERLDPMDYVGQDAKVAREGLEAKGYTVRISQSRFGEIDGVVWLHQTRDDPSEVVLVVSKCSPADGCPKSFHYTLYTHCGIRFASFGGRTWATHSLSDGSGKEARTRLPCPQFQHGEDVVTDM